MSDVGGKTPSPKKTGSATPTAKPAEPNVNEPSTEESFIAGLSDLTVEQKKLLLELYVANGQDAFDAEAAAVGRLKQDEYLALPSGWSCPRIPPSGVGRARARDYFRAKELAAIYKLNKERAPAGDNAIIYAMLRMEAVKMGWVNGQKEIVYLPFADYTSAVREFSTDLAAVRQQLDRLRLAAFLIPLTCEHTFRTMGHHYITGQATEYQARYRKTLKACLSEDLMNILQPANLFHHVLHWVSPERAYNVLLAQLETRTLPDAMILRASAAPAGWAIVTTTAAVLTAMESANLLEKIEEEFDGDLDEVRVAASKVRSDVRKYHKAYFAYNVAPPSPGELEVVEKGKATAIAFAPYAQGFIDGTLKDAALGQAMALKKHAELNPVAKQRAQRFFRSLTRVAVRDVTDLFKTQLEGQTRTDDDTVLV